MQRLEHRDHKYEKFFGGAQEAPVIKVGVTAKNLPMVLKCYHAKVSGSGATLPQVELLTKNFAPLWDSFDGSWGPKLKHF